MSEDNKPVVIVHTEKLDRSGSSDEKLDQAIRNAAQKIDRAIEERKRSQEDGPDIEEFTEWK